VASPSALPFFAVTPCRVADTRGYGFTGPYGSPFMAGGVPRNFTITGQCGIPAGAQAVSFNFTVTNTAGPGFLLVFPQGGAQPNVSTLNYVASQTIANAAVVPLGTGGLTAIPGVSGFNLLIDINGYYSISNPGNQGFEILNPAGTFGLYGTGYYYGVYGESPYLYGVFGVSTSGIGVKGTSTSNYGVWGLSTSSVGVEGDSTSNIGVSGISTGTGSTLYGVWGSSASTTAGSAGGFFVDWSGAPAGLSNYLSNLSFFPIGTVGVIGATSGTSSNSGGIGVLGITDSGFAGVAGVRLDTAGELISGGYLGWDNATAGLFLGNVNIVSSNGGLGHLNVVGHLSKGTGTFKIDDPIDPANKYLYHSFVESPDMMNIYNGIVELDALGEAIVTLPAYFEALNKDFRYQLTSIGRSQPNLYVADEIQNLQFRIAGGKPHAKASWQVTGVRQDPLANANRVIPEVEKEPQAKGYYLHWAAYKQPAEKSLTDHLAAIQKAGALKNDR